MHDNFSNLLNLSTLSDRKFEQNFASFSRRGTNMDDNKNMGLNYKAASAQPADQ